MTKRRIPVVLQMNSVECGAACLAMILGYFGRKTRLEECRTLCDPGRDGITAQTLVAAARQFGLRVKALSLRAQDLAQLPLPCILHWNRNHFVVLNRCSGTSIQIVDPAWGRRQLSQNELAEAFSGVVLLFQPGPPLKARAQSGPNLMFGYLKHALFMPGTRRVLAQILACSLVLQAMSFALPLFTKFLVDSILPLHNLRLLNLLGLGAIVAALLTAVFSYCRAVLLVRLEGSLDSRLMLGFFEHLLSLPYRFFQQRSSGDLLMRLASNSTIRDALASYTTSAILDGTLVIFFLAVLLHFAPLFGFAALSAALAEVTMLAVTASRLNCLIDNDLASQSASQSCLVESLTGICALKASGVERSTLNRWSGMLAKQIGASLHRQRFAARVDAATTVIHTLSPLCLLWIGGIQVADGSMSLGAMLAAFALAVTFLQPVGSLVASAKRVQLAGAHLTRIADVLEAKSEQDERVVRSAPPLSGKIEVRAVSFRYSTHSPKALDNISFTIHPGQKIAFVGRTGSGKSTLAKLLLGLYSPTEGEILYDGVPLGTLNLQTVRSQWGVVLQDSFLFSSSARDNISFHNSDMPWTDLVRAAEIAEIHDDIMRMRMAYETRIEEAGGSLSGGQRQRLAIARAVANRPAFLLLDEATSQLDVITESLVDRNLDALLCTRVVVAHRLSTIQNADRIIVFDEGAIVEQGSHEELEALNAHYAALIRNQSDRRWDLDPDDHLYKGIRQTRRCVATVGGVPQLRSFDDNCREPANRCFDPAR
jgi:ATP-binding cassette subfamily B protein